MSVSTPRAIVDRVRWLVARWRELHAFRRELRAALYGGRGCVIITVHRLGPLDARPLDVRTSSFTEGTGTRTGDRALIKAFSSEYLRLAKGDE